MEELFERWIESQNKTIESYNKMIDAQSEYDKLSSVYYKEGKPKNGINDIIIQEHKHIYDDVQETKKEYKRCDKEESINKNIYYHMKNKDKKDEGIDKEINYLYSN